MLCLKANADRSGMPVTWKVLEDSLCQRNPSPCFSSKEIGKFHDYVASVPAEKRVPLLLEAYQAYGAERQGTPRRGCDALNGDEGQFEKSVASVLISALLKSRLKPTKQEACDILKYSFHYCGHGGDVLAPVDLIEIAFQGKPFTPKLFKAARTYREALHELHGSQAGTARGRLNCVIWHDVSNPDAQCYTGAIQRAIAAMDGVEAFAWQWLLRKTVLGFRPGKTWAVEVGKRLDALGRDRFLQRLDDWVVVPKKKAPLTHAGANVLRLLVYHGTLFPANAVVPILKRLIRIPWKDPMQGREVYNALATLLARTPGRYRAESLKLCRRFAEPCWEVGQLQDIVNPAGAWKRREQIGRDREEYRAELLARKQLRSLRTAEKLRDCLKAAELSGALSLDLPVT
jgi:hypothetical protein